MTHRGPGRIQMMHYDDAKKDGEDSMGERGGGKGLSAAAPRCTATLRVGNDFLLVCCRYASDPVSW